MAVPWREKLGETLRWWKDFTWQNLVGGLNPSEKYDLVSWDDYSQYIENKRCSKPPTSVNNECDTPTPA